MKPGRFITFEGIDGAGKSTHIAPFAALLEARGHRVVITREPGGTELGEQLREITLTQSMAPLTELLLVFAARAEHLAARIRPALARGEWVVCDRFTDSTFAYQGSGRGIGTDRVRVLEALVHPDLQPDHTFLFDLAPSEAARRRAAARAADRFETEDLHFFERVRSGYLERAQESAGRFTLIDGMRGIDDIKKTLETVSATL
ncbi:MAG: dTMP kinase [Betaproteobacteria bacterium]|nr:dTMP kinase [Betaproteobacteria bacterium]